MSKSEKKYAVKKEKRSLRNSIKTLKKDITYLQSVKARISDRYSIQWCERQIERLRERISWDEQRLEELDNV